MEEKKNNKVFLIIVLVVLLIGAISIYAIKKGYIFGDNNGNEQTTNETKKADIEELEQKYLSVLYGYTDLSGVNNQAVMKAVIINSSFYPNETFTKEELDEAWKSSIFSKIPLKHEDFWFYGYNSDTKPTYSYSEETGKYTSNPVGHGACLVSPAYRKMIDYNETDGKYTAKYKYVWYYGCEGSQPTTLYGSYNDAKEKKNAIYEIDMDNYENGIIPEGTINQIIEDNWESFKDKLDTYTYTFITENNHYVLNFFQREEVKSNTSNNDNISELDYIRQTSIVLVEEPNCTGGHSTSLKAEINSNKNIAIAQDKAAEEIIVGNAKYLYAINLIACDNVKLYYITEDNGLYVIDKPSTGNPNQKGIKVTSSKVIEFLGKETRDNGSYLKVLTEDKKVEYIKYFTAPE